MSEQMKNPVEDIKSSSNNVNDFIEKVNESKQGQLDLSAGEDLSIAVMNLISIEEHFFFTAERTENNQYFDLLDTARQMRKDLLKKLIKDYEGEVWCISKHLLAASMRIMEVGTKKLGNNEREEAEELFNKSYELYVLFWGLVTGAVPSENIKMKKDKDIENEEFEIKESKTIKLAGGEESRGKRQEARRKKEKKIQKIDKSNVETKKASGNMMGKLKDMFKKAVDCCRE